MKVKVIGAGLAGSEAAWYLANCGVKVALYDIKPHEFSPAHKSPHFAELVCSNSLKSADVFGNAAGLLKEEMRLLGSITMEAAEYAKVPAGGALAVNREEFSAFITDKLQNHPNIEFISEEQGAIELRTERMVITISSDVHLCRCSIISEDSIIQPP